ncbi:hypothetical protein I316_01570 [Kwoniella heveanensis BCC8398]|uniref:Zn(2)-C6 fungal-type domain-containing protein n=1 Tax=Kwoniella heveanensis BCC8398 TaxID=1296120 RepID=A0A1B9H124_9TREE|nr:hypothetical protein I316_01570 [Kwoniella heveanensis BCC8398]
MPSRGYDPIYDNVLGPMDNRPTDPSDPGYMGPFGHLRGADGVGGRGGGGDGDHDDEHDGEDGREVGDEDTVSALKTLFGESAAAPDQNTNDHLHDHDHVHDLEHRHHRSTTYQEKEPQGRIDTAASTLVSHDTLVDASGRIDPENPPDVHQLSRALSPSLASVPANANAQNNDHGAASTDSSDTNATPERDSTASTSVPVKRKATSRANMLARGGACEFCKRRKLKCSAEVPTCANCLKIGKQCVYSQKKQRSRVRVLEDRLQELEKRLDQQNSAPHSQVNVSTLSPVGLLTPSADATPDPGTSSTGPLEHLPNPLGSIPPLDDGPTITSFNARIGPGSVPSTVGKDMDAEPDLMTLADAAAVDAVVGNGSNQPYAWEGMSPASVVKEIEKAVGGGKGVGEKIVSHLLQFYLGPTINPEMNMAISPGSLLSRLSNKVVRPIHPTLILSILPLLCHLSRSATLSSPAVAASLVPLARDCHAQAIASADSRLIDMIAATSLRAYWLVKQARLFEAWSEQASMTGLIHAAGLAKLGHVGERFVRGIKIPGRSERLARERVSRQVFKKGALVPAPESSTELGERIHLFWFAYLNERGFAFGWNIPSSLNDHEITTPWPKEEYDSAESLLDNRTVHDFLYTYPVDPATHDSVMCSQAKAMTLIYHAKRLFDLPHGAGTPERTARLKRVTEGYMSTLAPLSLDRYGESIIAYGERVQVWMTLHAALCVIHAKADVDAPAPIDGAGREHFDLSIASAGKILETVEMAQASGDVDLGLLIAKQANRISLSPSPRVGDEVRLLDLQNKKEGFSKALGILGTRFRFAFVGKQLLENTGYGAEYKFGEYERPDNVD